MKDCLRGRMMFICLWRCLFLIQLKFFTSLLICKERIAQTLIADSDRLLLSSLIKYGRLLSDAQFSSRQLCCSFVIILFVVSVYFLLVLRYGLLFLRETEKQKHCTAKK